MRLSDRIRARGVAAAVAAALIAPVAGTPAKAQIQIEFTAFAQTVAETAARDGDLSAFYRDREFSGLWTGTGEEAQMRRNAFLGALADAHIHGLPEARFNPEQAMMILRSARTPQEKAEAEVAMTRLFLDYARALNTGVLEPREVVSQIRREVQHKDRQELLASFAENPLGMLQSLPPSSPEYQRLVRAKMSLERTLAAGGYGPTVQATIRPGDSGSDVVRLRDRLRAMGYIGRTMTASYDREMVEAVEEFQADMGLEVDGVVGGATLEALNMGALERLESVLVAMERERWMNNIERGDRHIWVNLPDFTATIVDDGAVSFRTKSVIGTADVDRQTPEFSDEMDHMVINPYWYVPRSIIENEYLPDIRRNRNAHGQLQVINRQGQVVSRGAVRTGGSFPYSMRQPPGPSNALGRVKFMFPNQYNIYLHDTPAQHLFTRAVRAYSHGCIRLDDPYEFAYALLALQEDDPESFFQTRLRSGQNTRVNLEQTVPVHLVYRTAFTDVDGKLQFRDDIYGRDARIWDALAREGVAIRSVSG
ncbi:L,D-transpeptidase family protein [Histidinibacterium aquaticum]|uniref:L,D-transpeptidase family protein n=1 Tax=Histidinibacterium aquaticum TaxID=2613962 RepID=A0A5J5GK63_9RHOB|nr:L,D-transpeptidase family protein [Histidinibacterium aquaticum]KAA9008706.1 L,D-transpeptidase family protein [Histidinibacterium aquaticum]